MTWPVLLLKYELRVTRSEGDEIKGEWDPNNVEQDFTKIPSTIFNFLLQVCRGRVGEIWNGPDKMMEVMLINDSGNRDSIKNLPPDIFNKLSGLYEEIYNELVKYERQQEYRNPMLVKSSEILGDE